MKDYNLIPLPDPEPPVAQKFSPPGIEDCREVAVTLGMPAEEGEKFFYYHDQRDWMLGRVRMKKWRSAIALWKLNWAKWQMKTKLTDATKPLPMELFLWKTELERVEKVIATIRGSYSENMDMTQPDRNRLKDLRTRKSELLSLLGMSV